MTARSRLRLPQETTRPVGDQVVRQVIDMNGMADSSGAANPAKPIKTTSPAAVAGLVGDDFKASRHHAPAHAVARGRYDGNRHHQILRRVAFEAVHDGSRLLVERQERQVKTLLHGSSLSNAHPGAQAGTPTRTWKDLVLWRKNT